MKTRLVLIGLLAFTFSFGRAWHNAGRVDVAAVQPTPESGIPYAGIYRQPTTGWQVWLNASDGQAFAQLATDPALRRPDIFVDGRNEAAYRAQRPLFGYLTWAATLGQRDRVPVTLFVLTALSIAALVMTCGVWLSRRGIEPGLGLFAIFLPGVLSSMVGAGPDPLAAWLVLVAVMLYERQVVAGAGAVDARSPYRQLAPIAGVLAVAALTRETTMIVAFVLALVHWRRAGLSIASAFRSGAVLLAAAPLAAYFGWLAVVRVRFTAWPWNGEGRLQLVKGMFAWTDSWRWSDWVVWIGGFVLVFAVLAFARRRLEGQVVLGFGAFSLVLGKYVWHKWEDVGRVLLPMWVFAGLIVLTWLLQLEKSSARGEPVKEMSLVP